MSTIELNQQIEKNESLIRDLSRESQISSTENQKMEEDISKIVALYEITKEISKSLNEEEVFLKFKEFISRYIDFDDCRLFKDKAEIKDLPGLPGYELRAGGESLGILAMKGLAEKDIETFSILTDQLSLGLKRAQLYKRLEELAITDSTTLLFTRRYCLERLQEELARSIRRKLWLSFLMADIDHFKRYNDQFGHLVGDVVLRQVARIIKGELREIDLVGRYGGEEFLILLAQTDKQGAKLAAERIRQAVESQTIRAYDEKLGVTLSLGVATFPEDGGEAKELIDKADIALYRAKKQGRNRVCV